MSTSALPATAALEELEDWIQEHHVCWELAPHFESHDHRKLQVGFCLTLLARRSRGCALDPGCDDCFDVFERLKEIALRVIPEGARVEVEPFDSSFHLRPETNWEPEVELVVEILHREGTFDPPDAAERRYPAAIERHLEGLGVQPKTWKARLATQRA